MEANIQPIEFRRTPERRVNVRVIGVGGAGGNIVDHIASVSTSPADHIAINTDTQALERIRHARAIPLGAQVTRGLGTGGDPELGRCSADEERALLDPLVKGVDIVFLIAGLGGGTGTGAAPVVARAAREAGALVLSLATLPFECEGMRRRQQAHEGLEALRENSDAVICLPNERILKIVDERASVVDTLRVCNELLARGIQGISRMLTKPGIINVDFASLCAVLRGQHAESAFACVEARGESRALEVVDLLLVNPFMEGGQALNEAESVLVSIVGGPDLTMSEVNRIMEQIGHQCPAAHVIMGAAIEEDFLNRVAVTLVTSRGENPHTGNRARGSVETTDPEPPVRESRPAPPARTDPPGAPAKTEFSEVDTEFFRPPAAQRPASRFVPPPPENLPLSKKHELYKSQRGGQSKLGRGAGRMRQELLPLEIVSKGRFEKSEPTIHRGEDLDVPTYIRRGVALN